MKFQLLIKTKMLKNEDLNCLQTLRCYFYHANKSNNCLHFNIFEHDKFHAQLSLALIKVYILEAKFLAYPVGVFLLCFNALPPIQQFFNSVWGLFSVQRKKCLAQGHNTVPPVSLKPDTLDLKSIEHYHGHRDPRIEPLCSSYADKKTVWFLIRWLHQKPSDQDPHGFQKKI